MPKDWPAGHKWSPLIKDLTCEGCRVSLGLPPGQGTLISGPERLAVKLADRRYSVKIFEGNSPDDLESRMNGWLQGVGANVEVVRFFSVGGGAAVASTFPSKMQISSTDPGNYGSTIEKEKWVVGVLYVTQL